MKIGNWSVWWRDGFLRIFTVAFAMLGQLRVNDCPAAGLKTPAGVRKR